MKNKVASKKKSKKGHGRKNTLVYFLLTILVSLILLLMFFLFSIDYPVDVRRYEVRFLVGESPGVDLNGTALTFGRVTPGGSAIRKFIINNERDFPIRVRVLVSDEIEEYIDFDESLALSALENATISVQLTVPSNMEYGNYTGEIKFLIFEA